MFGHDLSHFLSFSYSANKENQWTSIEDYVNKGLAKQSQAQEQLLTDKEKKRQKTSQKVIPLALNQRQFIRGQLVLHSRDKKTLQTHEPKKRVCRVLKTTPRGLIVLDLTTNKIISSNLGNITPITPRTIDSYYPQEMFKNLDILCQDINRRPHNRNSLLLQKPTRNQTVDTPPDNNMEARPQRQRKPPTHLQDYDMSANDDLADRLTHFS